MMLYGVTDPGGLEVRGAGKPGEGPTITGRFPYGRLAVLSDGGRRGRPKKESFAKRAFSYRVNDPKADVHFLVGHDYNRPLASRLTGTLDLRDSDQALTFRARIAPEVAATTWCRDALALLAAGIAVGISPGFRLPPERQVPVAETITEEEVAPEEDKYGALIRTIQEASLYELSLVTVAAYGDAEAEVEGRSWDLTGSGIVAPAHPVPAHPLAALRRWRL
jgi:uncharacterized protein